MLNNTQKGTRDITSTSGKNTDGLSYRNNVSWSSGAATLPGGATNYSGVAMNYLSWGDLTAYLDWTGLRPMSELEYEKAGRGPIGAVSGGYAWGSTSITGATSITNGGTTSERGQTGSNINYDNAGVGVQGPLRVGSFGSGGVTSRATTGASYSGAFDLSGNIWERPVTVGNSSGRSFQGNIHGDGNLDTNGNANQSSWPSGVGRRGGSWGIYSSVARLSDRAMAADVFGSRHYNFGGRGVRSAAP
jgi:formylglycine-generating enzyme required for sulfatase activity